MSLLRKENKLGNMKNPLTLLGPLQFLLLLLLILYTSSWSWQGMAKPSMHLHHNFLHCLTLHSPNSTSISDVVHTPQTSSYQSIFELTAHNIRFTGPTAKKPLLIITPTQISHIQAAIICSKQHSLQIRVRSGGHDLEGLSFVPSHDHHEPFFLLDMTNFRSIDVDVENQVAWVQAAALLGELYYKVAEKSENLGFPAGVCTTVGVGGHLSGGGYGALLRKYGLAADNIIDAELVDADGRLLDRKSMGEDLFWAIRGGGGASFGVIIAFQIRLVHVPSRVTLCSIIRTPNLQNATGLVYDWQFIAPHLPEEVFSLIFMTQAASTSTAEAKKTAQALFLFMSLGNADDLITLLHHRYPRLEASNENCEEMSWIESVLVIAGLSRETPREALLDRTISTNLNRNKYHGKVKSDYVQKPIPEIAIDEIWKRLSEAEGRMANIYFVAYGGKMSEIPETDIPFPHRSGNLFMMGYLLYWEEEGVAASDRHIEWSRNLYHFMEPYVSKSPRQSYLNYRDLDIGTNTHLGTTTTSFEEASIWGFKYFKNNFHKLAQVKAKVDPTNLFRTEQSIPVLPIWWISIPESTL